MARKTKKQTETLKVIPLGGLGEFGKNMMAFEYGDDMIVVDCGMMFPEEDMLGVDAVIPDFTYIDERIEKLRGIILTHGHEDHIGALPYFFRDYEADVYGSRLTMELVRAKLREANVLEADRMHDVQARSRVELGAFTVEFLQVTHSMPDSMALAIDCPLGTIIHTGDYKLDASDETETSDFFSLSKRGEEGVLLLLGDSTNFDRKGNSPGEKSVKEGLRPIIADCEGTVILSTFSSGLHRVQTVLSLAQELGRKVFIAGFSLERNFAIATKLGLLDYPEGLVYNVREIDRFASKDRILLCTGSQGEPLSVLSRLALDSYRYFHVSHRDTVIFSARMIPGNERGIYRIINHFCRRGAKVITEKDAAVHASGHAYRDEMLQLYRMLKPEYFVPLHGELRQLMGNRELAVEAKVNPDNIFVMESGDTLEISERGAGMTDAKVAGQVLVDGKIFEQVEEVVLRDRKHLSEDGMITVILVIDKQTHEITAGPDFVTRGFVEVDTSEDLLDACRDVVIDAFNSCDIESREEWEVVKSTVRKALRKFLRKETDRYPLILPVVMEI